jgi:sulfite exporter TauE/SafE
MYTAALLLGLAGSLHCVGMCGPLMLALHGPPDTSGQSSWVSVAQYQTGRILTYAGLGLFFGLAGKGLALAGMQQILSVSAGILMIAFALMAWRIERIMNRIPTVQHLVHQLQYRMSSLLQIHPWGASFSFGLLNGLIPCGMVYAALAGAIATADIWEGAGFMVFFGLGTAPLMMATGILGHSFSGAVRRRFKVLQPILLLVSGFLLIQRGLHLDLSLFESAVPPAGVDCH